MNYFFNKRNRATRAAIGDAIMGPHYMDKKYKYSNEWGNIHKEMQNDEAVSIELNDALEELLDENDILRLKLNKCYHKLRTCKQSSRLEQIGRTALDRARASRGSITPKARVDDITTLQVNPADIEDMGRVHLRVGGGVKKSTTKRKIRKTTKGKIRKIIKRKTTKGKIRKIRKRKTAKTTKGKIRKIRKRKTTKTTKGKIRKIRKR